MNRATLSIWVLSNYGLALTGAEVLHIFPSDVDSVVTILPALHGYYRGTIINLEHLRVFHGHHDTRDEVGRIRAPRFKSLSRWARNDEVSDWSVRFPWDLGTIPRMYEWIIYYSPSYTITFGSQG
jgi:hypothetical protein